MKVAASRLTRDQTYLTAVSDMVISTDRRSVFFFFLINDLIK